MTTVPNLSQLKIVDLREAWAHEAHNFTPWLAENIGQLSEAVGIPLEVEGTEVSVESFSADILARNTMDDSIVLIENQLEGSDHTHLGQIMTYLAGLEAHTIIWVAKDFREPHLAALRWLNDHTGEDLLSSPYESKSRRSQIRRWLPYLMLLSDQTTGKRRFMQRLPTEKAPLS